MKKFDVEVVFGRCKYCVSISRLETEFIHVSIKILMKSKSRFISYVLI